MRPSATSALLRIASRITAKAPSGTATRPPLCALFELIGKCDEAEALPRWRGAGVVGSGDESGAVIARR
jgi:hypothetical protein